MKQESMFDFIEVEAIGLTQPIVDYIPDSAGILSYCARVSNPSNQENFETAGKLLAYCVKHKHFSVFETCSLTMKIVAPRDIARQILRHRSFSFQEFCIAGDSLITTLTPNGNTKKVKIEDLYKRFNSRYWKQSDNLVRIFDENSKTLIPAKIKEVFDTGIKPVYKMTLENGKAIECTLQHKFLTKEGFKKLEDLKVGDFVGCNGVSVWQSKEWMREAKIESLKYNGLAYIAEKAGVSEHTIRKWLAIHGLQFTKREVAQYTTPWNKGLPSEKQPMFGKTMSEETREKQRSSVKKGKDSNLYKNGTQSHDSILFYKRARQYSGGYKNTLLIEQNYKCALSGKDVDESTAEVDHIMPVYSHPELAFERSNLQVLHKDVHRKKTTQESCESRKTVRYAKVSSIQYIGDKQTYDMEIEHESHNYVANGVITHNSQRYAEVQNFIVRECRMQDDKNRQNSLETADQDSINWWDNSQREILDLVQKRYSEAIDKGIAKEVARCILPEGLTLSHMYMQGTVRSWLHFIQVRDDLGVAQKEVVDVARKVKVELLKQFPFLIDVIDSK